MAKKCLIFFCCLANVVDSSRHQNRSVKRTYAEVKFTFKILLGNYIKKLAFLLSFFPSENVEDVS